jgi:hypothetical protein
VRKLNVLFVFTASFVWATQAAAGPVVRQATGTNAAAIQLAVDLFRADLGNPNNGNAAGSQAGGRREINWDGGGAAASATQFPIPMTTFSNRGSIFFTPGTGFEQSGQPTPEFGDLNPTYPGQFAAFSSPRLFTALNSNVTDVVFHVPGDTTIPAAVTGFGSVFTDVDSQTSTKMEFYAPDGGLIWEGFVPATPGTETLSFLGASFTTGELVARVRIISGNAAPGPDETGNLDVVVMDDFIFGEPVSTAGLTITPETGKLFQRGGFDIMVGLEAPAGVSLVSGSVKLDGGDVTSAFASCVQVGRIVGGGQTFRCPPPRGFLSAGQHVLQVEFNLSNQTRVRNAVLWTIVASLEP